MVPLCKKRISRHLKYIWHVLTFGKYLRLYLHNIEYLPGFQLPFLEGSICIYIHLYIFIQNTLQLPKLQVNKHFGVCYLHFYSI